MKGSFAFFMIVCACSVKAQTVINADTISFHANAGSVYNCKLFSDSLSSSFVIIIKDEVKPHFHSSHSEQIIVHDGEGLMRLGDKKFKIKKGDVVFIPAKTVHAVKSTGKNYLKVVSVQSPFYDGKDKIMVEE